MSLASQLFMDKKVEATTFIPTFDLVRAQPNVDANGYLSKRYNVPSLLTIARASLGPGSRFWVRYEDNYEIRLVDGPYNTYGTTSWGSWYVKTSNQGLHETLVQIRSNVFIHPKTPGDGNAYEIKISGVPINTGKRDGECTFRVLTTVGSSFVFEK